MNTDAGFNRPFPPAAPAMAVSAAAAGPLRARTDQYSSTASAAIMWAGEGKISELGPGHPTGREA
jgi:hypothetical protein